MNTSVYFIMFSTLLSCTRKSCTLVVLCGRHGFHVKMVFFSETLFCFT